MRWKVRAVAPPSTGGLPDMGELYFNFVDDGPSSNMDPIHCGKKADVATCPVRFCSFTCSLGIHVRRGP